MSSIHLHFDINVIQYNKMEEIINNKITQYINILTRKLLLEMEDAMRFELTKDLLVGNEQLDNDTKMVLSKINYFLSSVDDYKKTFSGTDNLKTSFRDLLDYIEECFQGEEEMMHSINYAHRNSHIHDHMDLLSSFEDFYNKMVEDSAYISTPTAMQGLGNTLYQFLETHVKEQDKKLIKVLKRKKLI